MTELLTEEQRRLMGIGSREFGGVPAMFQRAQDTPATEEQEILFEPRSAPQASVRAEGRMTLYRDEETMMRALERANEIVGRVTASLRKRPSEQMTERERTAVERLERKLGTAYDALEGAQRALGSMCKGKKNEALGESQAASD